MNNGLKVCYCLEPTQAREEVCTLDFCFDSIRNDGPSN